MWHRLVITEVAKCVGGYSPNNAVSILKQADQSCLNTILSDLSKNTNHSYA